MADDNKSGDTSPLSDEDIRAKLLEMRELLTALEGGTRRINLPFHAGAQANITDLRRHISMYESILERRAYSRTARHGKSPVVEVR